MWQQSEDGAVYLVVEDAEAGRPAMKMDLRSITSMTGKQALEHICNKAGVEREDVRFVWSSPPCETHSRANRVNEDRGHHHRLNIPGFPPRPDGSKYVRKAQEHDEITQLIMMIIEAAGKGAL